MNRLVPVLRALLLLGVAGHRAVAADDPRLIPRPREITGGDFAALARAITIEAGTNNDDRSTARDLADHLKDRGLKVTVGAATTGAYVITLTRLDSPVAIRTLKELNKTFSAAMKPEGYVIVTTKDHAIAIANTSAGLFYAAQTIKQLIRTDEPGEKSARIFTATIRDWPAMRYRGFHDDFSRGPIHTLDFIRHELRTLAAYKVNVYSPYFEHTLEYASTPLAAPPGGALSREDIKAIVAAAARYHIDVIPEQEAFGHLHHLLKYDLYAPLGETEHGHVLAPGDSAALPLIRSWFAEIDTLFPSKFVHLGADETFELGMGRTHDRVARDGLPAVYVNFLQQIESVLRYTGKRFLFWGDVAGNAPNLVKSLPKDMIAVGWGYGAAPNTEKLAKPFIDAGIETWVAPGVNGWNRVYPNNDVTLRNIQAMARDGQRLGATGLLNTSWADDGEALFNQQWYGILFGAAASWQSGESSIEDFQASYGIQFHGDPSGMIDDAQRKLSAAHALLTRAGLGDATNALYWIDPYSSEGQVSAEKIRVVSRDVRVLAESAMVLIAKARAARPGKLREPDALDAMSTGARRMDFIGMKFELADEIVRLYAHASDPATRDPTHDLTEIASNINSRTQDIRDGYVLGRELYERSWLAENRPYWLYNVLNRYDLAAQLWIQRLDRVNQARAQWTRTRKLPSPEEVGIPRSMPGFTP